MAFVVPTKRGRFEVRESRSTPNGPRSRTLVSFKEMDDEVIEKAIARSAKPLDPSELRSSALRAGAQVALPEVDQAGRKTLRSLSRGARLDPMTRRLLLDALGNWGRADEASSEEISDTARAASQWIGSDPEERGQALCDLLELADAFPVRLRPAEISFPRLRSV
jgi:hypothetical protein